MTLDELLTSLERGVDTPDTPCNPAGVSAKPAQIGACTPDTPDTSQKDNEENDGGSNHARRKPARWWRFHYRDGVRKEASYCPPATYAEVLAGEPDAIKAEPFEPILRKPNEPLSEEVEAVIRALLADIGEADEGVITVALEQCRTDQDARDAFLKMAKQ